MPATGYTTAHVPNEDINGQSVDNGDWVEFKAQQRLPKETIATLANNCDSVGKASTLKHTDRRDTLRALDPLFPIWTRRCVPIVPVSSGLPRNRGRVI